MSEATQNYVRLELTQGKCTLINAEDLESINEHRWIFDSSNGYARAKILRDGKIRTVSLHQFLINPPKGLEVDHINGDKLDNTRSNLRIATRHQNSWNVDFYSHSNGSHKGAYQRKVIGGVVWDSKISVNDKSVYLGTFKSKEEAIEAYKKKGAELRGEFFTIDRGPKKDFYNYPLIQKPKRIDHSSSGFTNVYKRPKGSKYFYMFKLNGILYQKGGFSTAVLASAAVEAKIKELRQ